MVSGYQAGYVAGRFFTRMVKFYLVGRLVDSTFSKAGRFSKDHKIDSKNPEIVTENLFNCLEYLD